MRCVVLKCIATAQYCFLYCFILSLQHNTIVVCCLLCCIVFTTQYKWFVLVIVLYIVFTTQYKCIVLLIVLYCLYNTTSVYRVVCCVLMSWQHNISVSCCVLCCIVFTTQFKCIAAAAAAQYCVVLSLQHSSVLYCLAADEDAGTQYKTIQHTFATVCCIASQCIAARQYNAMLQQLTRMWAPNTKQYNTPLQRCVVLPRSVLPQDNTTYCCSSWRGCGRPFSAACLGCISVYGRVLHCVALCCGVWKCCVVFCSGSRGLGHLFWAAGPECVSVCCTVLQHVAASCSDL